MIASCGLSSIPFFSLYCLKQSTQLKLKTIKCLSQSSQINRNAYVTMYINTFMHKRNWKSKLLAEKEKNIKGSRTWQE